MRADHNAAHTHNRRDEDIEEKVLRPKKPESRHQRDNRRAMPEGNDQWSDRQLSQVKL